MIQAHRMNGAKIWCCFLFFALAVTQVFTGGVTYARYLTQNDCAIPYSTKSATYMYANASIVDEKSLISISEWNSSLNETSAEITLSNFIGESAQLPKDDIVFCVRAYVTQQGLNIMDKATEEQTGALPMDITLSTGDTVYTSKSEKLSEKTDFYIKNQDKGKFFCFYTGEDGGKSEESTFCLSGNNQSEITFTVTVYNAPISAEHIRLCVDRL